MNGQKFLEYVEEQWELQRTEKEKEKLARVGVRHTSLFTSQPPSVDEVLSPKQQLKKSKQTEEDMLYGTAIRTPTKRRFLGTTTPNKTRKVVEPIGLTSVQPPPPPPLLTLSLCASPQLNATSSTSSATSNSTMRSAFCGTVCRSPVPRPPLSANKVGFISEMRELTKRAKKKSDLRLMCRVHWSVTPFFFIPLFNVNKLI